MVTHEPPFGASHLDLVDFGDALLRLRRARGLCQAELAVRTQVAASTVSRLERGRLPPSADLTLRISAALSLEPPVASWLAELSSLARLLHAAQQELPHWRGAKQLVQWLHAQRSSVRSRKEDAPT